MGLYDIIGEITEKQVTKTETGDNRIFGVLTGIVAKNYDESMKGRVCVTIPLRDKDANELQWARVAMPSSGKSWGHYFLPEVGDQVLLVFENGNIEKPYIIGCIPKEKDKFLSESADEKNQFKKIVTTHGNTVVFEDNSENEDGEKDKIRIFTSKETLSVSLDNEKMLMSVKDKEGKNQIVINAKDGNINIDCEKKMTVKVNDVELNINGSSGNVSLKCKNFKVEADSMIELKASGKLKLEGANATLTGTSSVEVTSNASCKVSGTPIQIG